MSDVITPQMVENELRKMSKDVDASFEYLSKSESTYFKVKADYEIQLARARVTLATGVKKLTVQEKEDHALLATERLHYELATAEAEVRSARANAQRVRTQVDILRSVGTSVRSSMETV